MSPPRGLSEAEAAAWAKLAATVDPLRRPATPRAAPPVGESAPAAAKSAKAPPPSPPKFVKPARNNTPPPGARIAAVQPTAPPPPPTAARLRRGHLDSRWERRFKSGDIAPDLALDLHGHGLDAAYTRLMHGMAQARAVGARVVLVVAGKPRPVDPADRAERRGAIRAKMLDWLAASDHADAIAAIRKAHRRHGGDGALYIVLRRDR